MTIAKYAYLLDKVLTFQLTITTSGLHLGPYTPEIKKVIIRKDFFTLENGQVEVINTDKLFSYNNPYKERIKESIIELAALFSGYSKKERSHKTELLATVCKVVEDIQSVELKDVRQSMKEWPIELATTRFKNKAEKFTEDETSKCLKFIIEKGWQNQLLGIIKTITSTKTGRGFTAKHLKKAFEGKLVNKSEVYD